jgi:hypothetical protein
VIDGFAGRRGEVLSGIRFQLSGPIELMADGWR